MNPYGPYNWDAPPPRWRLPLFVLTIVVAAGFGAALAFIPSPIVADAALHE